MGGVRGEFGAIFGVILEWIFVISGVGLAPISVRFRSDFGSISVRFGSGFAPIRGRRGVTLPPEVAMGGKNAVIIVKEC